MPFVLSLAGHVQGKPVTVGAGYGVRPFQPTAAWLPRGPRESMEEVARTMSPFERKVPSAS